MDAPEMGGSTMAPGLRGACPAGVISTVLIAEDSPTVRLMARTVLAAGGYRVLEAADGAEALELARQHRPDLVVLDLYVPRLTGIEATRALRPDAGLAATPVVLLSASEDQADRGAGAAAGVSAYLARPFTPSTLLALARDLLSGTPAGAPLPSA